MDDKYQDLFDEAAAEYAAANEIAKGKAGIAQGIQSELSELEAEYRVLHERVADFESSKLVLTLEEYQIAIDRIRYIEIRVKGARKLLQNAANERDSAYRNVTGIGSKWRGVLIKRLDEDHRRLQAERLKTLDEVMR